MADNTQCPSCGKHYPDFVKRTELRRTNSGRITTGAVGAYPATIGILLLIAALVGWLNHLAPFLDQWPDWLLLTLLVLGLLGIIASLLSAIFWFARLPRAGYRYHCKNCGKDWRVEKPAA